MDDLNQKLQQIKWLKDIGIEYYCSDKKDSNILPVDELKIDSKITDVPKQEEKQNKNILQTTIQHVQKEIKEEGAVAETRQLADNAKTIGDLRSAVENFDGCDLKKFATNTVFSDGVPDAKILLVGEAPGATEDQQGVPFCGESGQLLDKMLACIGLSRKKNIYITNTIFWRPPGNRRPTNDETDMCKPFVEKHIALIKPKLIILVGGTATSTLLGKEEGVTKLRKSYYSYSNKYLSQPIQTTAIFHPAYLLRQPAKKKDSWYDLLRIQQFVEENIL